MASRNSNKGFTVRHPVIVDLVGCNCRRPRLSLSSLFSSSHSSKPKSTSSHSSLSSTTLTTTTTTTTTDTWEPPSFTTNSLFYEPAFVLNEGRSNSSSNANPRERKPRRKKRTGTGSTGANRVRRESVPVTVDSREPYEDFRESMVQMIVQKEIYAWDDLNELLHQFLSLNSPHHHPLILHAFADLWNGLFSPPSPCV